MATNIGKVSPPALADNQVAGALSSALLDRFERGADASGTSAQAVISVGPFNRKALVLANAYGNSHYQGPTANAGITITLANGNETVQDDSFEGESSNITFRAQASLMFVLPVGVTQRVDANLSPMGSGGRARNRQTEVKLHVIAIGL